MDVPYSGSQPYLQSALGEPGVNLELCKRREGLH